MRVDVARGGLAAVLSGWAVFTGLLITDMIQVDTQRHEIHQRDMRTPIITPYFVKINDSTILKVPSWKRLEQGKVWSYVSRNDGVDPNFAPEVDEIQLPKAEWITDHRLQHQAARSLEQWAKAAENAQHPIIVTSAYRSAKEQEALRKDMVQQYGAEYVEKFSAPVGHSEHQLGLAVDFSSSTEACKKAFEHCALDNDTAAWLAQTAHEYGFILRYPSGKEHITGTSAESWHFRYVGKEMAQVVHDSGLTFDEIIAKLRGYQKSQPEVTLPAHG